MSSASRAATIAAGAGGAAAVLLAAVLVQRPGALFDPAHSQLDAALEEKAALLRQLDTVRQWANRAIAQAEREQNSCRELQENAAAAERELSELRWQLRVASTGRSALPAAAAHGPAHAGADGCDLCPPVAPPSGGLPLPTGTLMLQGIAKEVLSKPSGAAARATGADDVTVSLTIRHEGSEISRHVHAEMPLHLAGERLGLRGLPLALGTMAVGERARFLFAPDTGYGAGGDAALGVPPRATVEAEVELHQVAEVEDLSADGTKSVLKRVMTSGKGSENPATGATVTVRIGAPSLEDSLVGAAAALAGVAEGQGAAAGTVALNIDDTRALGEALRLVIHSMRRSETALITLSPNEARQEPLLAPVAKGSALVAEPVVAVVELVSFRQARDSAAAIAATAASVSAAFPVVPSSQTEKPMVPTAEASDETKASAAGSGGASNGAHAATASALASATELKDRANQLFGSGRRDEACAVYSQALAVLQSVPTSADAATLCVALHNNLANCELSAGRPTEALSHADAALALSSGSAKALYRRAQALSALGRTREAEADAALALRETPSNAQLQKLHASLAEQLAAPDAARETPVELLMAAGALKNEANSLFSSGQRVEACTKYSSALERVQKSPVGADRAILPLSLALRNNLANCELVADRPVDALAHADAALQLSPMSAKALYRRAQALHALGRQQDAQAAVTLALQQNPGSHEVAKLRSAIAAALSA